VISLKKILIITISLFLIFQFFFVVKAKTEVNKGDGSKSEGYVSPSEAAKAKTATAKLNRILEVTTDPEVEEEVGEMAEEQEQVDQRAQQAIDKTNNRPAAVKFLIGPDYKNLGQLRKEVVQTRNNIRKLEQLQEKAGAEELPAIQAALLELEESASRLQSEIYTKLSDFSLFGWLFRWLSGFTPPEDEVSPTPTTTPTITGVVLTVTPTVELTLTPTVTASPTMTPTPTPTI
jgi:hypothetical protein